MKDKIVTGKITNLETGETTDIIPFYLFYGGFELNTFVKILRVQSFLREENSREICIDALALDSGGFVFKLNINFLSKSVEEEKEILSDITEGKILAARGYYSVLSDKDGGISLHDPIFSPLPPEYSLEEIEKVFRINNTADKNRLM
jgi:hypothetical protein